VAAAAVMGVTALVSGCGDNGGAADAQPTATPPPSRSEFVRQGNAACRRVRTGLEGRIATYERNRAGQKPRPYADTVHFVFLPTIEAELWELGKLDVPSEDEHRVEFMLYKLRTTLDFVATQPSVASLAAAERMFHRPDKVLRAYGLTACVVESKSRN
jgi:hypothetical protein